MKRTFLILILVILSIGPQLKAAGNSDAVFYLETFGPTMSNPFEVHYLEFEKDIVEDFKMMGNGNNEQFAPCLTSEEKKFREFVCANLGKIDLQQDISVSSCTFPKRLLP